MELFRYEGRKGVKGMHALPRCASVSQFYFEAIFLGFHFICCILILFFCILLYLLLTHGEGWLGEKCWSIFWTNQGLNLVTECEMSRVKTFSNIQENWRDVQLFQAFPEHIKEHTGSTSANQLIAMTTSYHLFIGISWIVNDHFDSQFYCYNKYVYLDRKWTYRIDDCSVYWVLWN